MAIPLDLLTLTGKEALSFTIYGGPGLKKTNAIHTLPPPILMHNWDKGISSILPWIRRIRQHDSSEWTPYTQEERQQSLDLLSPKIKATISIKPAPYIDVVNYDNMDYECYSQWQKDAFNIDHRAYNSVVCDSIQEHTGSIMTAAKGAGNSLDEMETKYWSAVQDKSIAALRYYRNLRTKGVFVYLTCSEYVDKDYVTDPRNTPAGKKPEKPHSVKGTVNVAGKVVPAVLHTTDILLHARTLGDRVVWVSEPERIGESEAFWEVKDRTGRIKESYNPPNVRTLMDQIYGEEIRKKIYSHGQESLRATNS